MEDDFESGSRLYGRDPNVWRLSYCGRLIRRGDRGCHTTYGWVYDPAIQAALHWSNSDTLDRF